MGKTRKKAHKKMPDKDRSLRYWQRIRASYKHDARRLRKELKESRRVERQTLADFKSLQARVETLLNSIADAEEAYRKI